MTNYKGTIEQHISDLELAIADEAESESHLKYWQREKEFLEELRWYREQDLIKRDDMCQFFATNDYCEDVDCDRCEKRIPKAEPPCVNSNEIKRELSEKSNERNGDCETCKHYEGTGGRWCKSCSRTYLDNYEPYIPKENE